jgi:cyclic pyranopterin phosphate synthase
MTENIIENYQKNNLVDPFNRNINYLRISVTDRCDFRCVYCMSENMTFLPKVSLLTLEELYRLASLFIDCGIKKIRLTGGEPLVRKNIMWLIEQLSRKINSNDLEELTLTSNGSQLIKHANDLANNNVRRINVSIDSLNEDLFKKITRWGDLKKVIEGIQVAKKAGIRIKINTVALKGVNDEEIPNIIKWAHDNDMDITLIETMPMGDIDGDRTENYLSLTEYKETLKKYFTLRSCDYKTGGPSRYYICEETGGVLGLITPLSHNFCADCNRVRITCSGKMYMCLGQDDSVDFNSLMRSQATDKDIIDLIHQSIRLKPISHDFKIDKYNTLPAVSRHMSVTGG